MVASADLLRSSALFRRLSPEDLQRVGAIAGTKTYENGDTIFSEGDPPHLLYTVVSGRVKIVKGVPQSGREVILEIFGPGDPLGAVVAYEDRPYPASAVALERTLCLRLPRADFFDLLARHPSVVRGFLSGMAQRIVELTRRIAEVSGGRVETRFALLFLKLADKLGRPDGREVFIPLALTRQDLADLTGTTVETAIRVMSRWSKEDVVLTEHEGFRVKSRAALERLARA
jgi:CRP-like cAMP-binding protein